MGNPSLVIRRALRSVGIVALGLGFTTSVNAQNKILDQLEAGQVVSGKSGSTVLVQSIVKKEAPAVLKSLSEDLSKLPNVIGQVAFARPFKTKDGKRLLYLKIKGLGDGTAVLMEVKEGPRDAFTNARELLKSGDFGRYREAARADINEVGDLGLEKDLSKSNASSETQRILGSDSVILLEGPLNQIPAMPQLRVTLQISVAPYSVIPAATGIAGSPAPAMKNYSLLQVRAAFGNQAPIGGDLGDYRGFGERHLSLAQIAAEDVLASVKARLEKI